MPQTGAIPQQNRDSKLFPGFCAACVHNKRWQQDGGLIYLCVWFTGSPQGIANLLQGADDWASSFISLTAAQYAAAAPRCAARGCMHVYQGRCQGTLHRPVGTPALALGGGLAENGEERVSDSVSSPPRRVILQIPWAVATMGIIFNLPGASGAPAAAVTVPLPAEAHLHAAGRVPSMQPVLLDWWREAPVWGPRTTF